MAEDFEDRRQRAETEAAALDAERKLIEARQALANTRTVDPAAAQLAAATQAAGIAAQQKALADSQAAILKSRFAVPDSGFGGDIKVGDKAGGIEAALLAARAIGIGAQQVVEAIKDNIQGQLIVLYGGSDLPDFQSLIAFRLQSQAVGKTLKEAIVKLDAAQREAAPQLPRRLAAIGPAAIGGALDAANKILGYLRSDYSIQGVTVTPDDMLLVTALARVLRENDAVVNLPALYNAAALLDDVPIVTDLQDLANQRITLQQTIDLESPEIDQLQTLAASETDPAQKQRIVDAATNLKLACDQGRATASMYDGLLTKLTTPDDKAKTPLAGIVQQDAVRQKLKSGALLMTAKLSSAGGTYYTKKSLLSFFGAMPFFTMGGVVLSYSVFNGKNGSVVSAGAIPVDGGFFKVGQLPKVLTTD